MSDIMRYGPNDKATPMTASTTLQQKYFILLPANSSTQENVLFFFTFYTPENEYTQELV